MFTIIEYVMYAILGLYGALLPLALLIRAAVQIFESVSGSKLSNSVVDYGAAIANVVAGSAGALIVLWLINQIQ